MKHAVAFSHGIRALRHIERFLGVASVVSPSIAIRRQLPLACVVVWGRKQNAKRALEFAQTHQLPVRFVEDGWIRNCSKNAHSRLSYSLLIDSTGVYYDSEQPSDLENYLNQADTVFDLQCDSAAQAYARHCRTLMVRHCITKYNFCQAPDEAALHADSRALVIVVDQTRDDASVRLGGLQAQDFHRLLDRALAENPQSRVIVRTHPDVIAGKRKAYLSEYARAKGVEVRAVADNPIPWLKKATRVYAGTSQLGYEALMCGCQVSVAGKPFYAGWGLTEDYQLIPRRTKSRSLDQLFHATHVYLASYRDPVSGGHWSLHECIEHVLVQQRSFERNAHQFACVGITPWKRRYVSQYLRSPAGKVRFCQTRDIREGERAVYWSFRDARTRGQARAKTERFPAAGPVPVSRMEDGFIRSLGLGSDFVAPASLVIDHTGLYFDPSSASDLETLLNTFECSEKQIQRGAALRLALSDARLTKYNVGKALAESPAPVRRRKPGQLTVLVVGQVEDDQSILRGCRDVSTNGQLCEAVRAVRPDAYIVYKPHPDVESGNRQGAVSARILSDCVDHVEREKRFLDCLEYSDELHTMTSLSGFEALLRARPVFTYGLPFYAGWGLTTDLISCSRRQTRRSVDELVFLSLVEYPSYLDIASGEFVTVEQLIESLRNTLPVQQDNPGEMIRFLSRCQNIRNALRYNP